MAPRFSLLSLFVIICSCRHVSGVAISEIRCVHYADDLSVAKGACPAKMISSDGLLSPLTVQRGSIIRIDGFKDNMLGGFVRFSLVPIDGMFAKEAHDKYAFHYTCADTRPVNCTDPNSKMCRHDFRSKHYRYKFVVPEIFYDGIYVIAMARYGSFPDLRSTNLGYGLGDYYSCTLIRVSGGAMNSSYLPTFEPGPTIAGSGGFCRGIYNDMKCSYELCFFHHSSVLLKPLEFSNGMIPKRIVIT